MTHQLRELILHIGTGKTGTSSLQSLLGSNRSILAGRGWLYPRTPGSARHTKLGLYLKDDSALERTPAWRHIQTTPEVFRAEFASALRSEIDDTRPHGAILSDEALYGSSAAALTLLGPLTRQLASRVRALVYLRRQDEHVVSRYQQVVKLGSILRLHEHVERSWSSKIYDYRTRLDTWCRLVGPDALIVRRFDPATFVAGSLYEDFITAAGLPLTESDLSPVRPRNESIDAEGVEMLRLLNLWRREHPDEAIPSNQRLVPRLARSSSGISLTLPREQLNRFMARWEESNRAVAQDLLDIAVEELFPTPRRTGRTTSEQRIDPDRVDDLLALLEIPHGVHSSLHELAVREAKR